MKLNGGQYIFLWLLDICFLVFVTVVFICCIKYVNILSVLLLMIYAPSFIIDYVYYTARVPTLICSQNGCLAYFVKYKLEEPHKLFLPNVLLLKPFLQTFGAPIIRHYNSFTIKYKREVFTLSDGEKIALDWYCGEPLPKFKHEEKEYIKPIALFVTDIREDTQSPDLRLLIPMAFESGYRCVVLHYRGCGNMKLKQPRLVSLFDVQDTKEVVDYLKSKTNKVQCLNCLVAIGFGFGGNQIINYLIKIGDKSKIDAAVLVSITFDFFQMHSNLTKSYLGRAISCQTVNYFKYIINNNEELFKGAKSFRWNYEEVMSSKLQTEFDSNYTIKMNTLFENIEEYYKHFSAKGKLAKIKVPVLFINSLDDPLSTDLPCEEIRNTNGIAMVLTSVGGHKGFNESLSPPFFIERVVDEFLIQLFTVSIDISTVRKYLLDNSTIAFI